MISLGPVLDRKKVKDMFAQNNITFNDKCGCVEASDKGDIIGFCLFEMDDAKITILSIYPVNDLSLTDGILRSTLHVAAERSIMDARYGESVDENIFRQLNFIKDYSKRQLDIDKLFKGCSHCSQS